MHGGQFTHNHNLPKTFEESLPYQYNHEIPADLVEYATALQGMRMPADLHQQMVRIQKCRKMPITWTETDVRNRFGAQMGVGAWDVDQFLRKMTATSSFSKYQNDELGYLMHAYWSLNEEDASVSLSAGYCVIFDNTFNTNKYGFKLGFFTTVDRFGSTRIKAATIMAKETVDSFRWVVRAIVEDLGRAPKVFLTDGDLWMAEAIDNECGNRSHLPAADQSVHLLCIWHLSKTVWKHVSPCFRASYHSATTNSAFQEFVHAWWSFAQSSDISGRDTFDRDWTSLKTRLRDLLPVDARGSQAFSHALHFLGGPKAEWEMEDDDNPPAHLDLMELGEDGQKRQGSLYDARTKWAARFTYSSFTHGASSTARGEMCFATLKHHIQGGGSLAMLVESVTQQVESKVTKTLQDLPRRFLLLSHMHQSNQPLIKQLSIMGATPFLLSLAMAILARVTLYKAEALDNAAQLPLEQRKFRVSFYDHASDPTHLTDEQPSLLDMGISEDLNLRRHHITSFTSCSCLRPLKWGVFCGQL